MRGLTFRRSSRTETEKRVHDLRVIVRERYQLATLITTNSNVHIMNINGSVDVDVSRPASR